MAPPEVSKDIDAWCIKCDLLLAHVVMSMKGTRPHRVKCKTCKDVHAYRISKPAKRKPAAPKVPRKTQYQVQMEERDTSGAIPYTQSGTYQYDAIIDHAKFGIGLVTQLIGATKIEVLFPDGTKLLVCGR